MTNSQEPQSITNESPKPKRIISLLYIGLALIIAIWTTLGALFFLAVVGVLRLNPKADIQANPTEKDIKVSRNIYRWIWLLPIIGVPWFGIATLALDSYSSGNERMAAALYPLIVYTPLLLYLNSKSLFVYRHAQQAILLVAARAGLAGSAIILNDYPMEGLGLFLIFNGALWLFGNIWAGTQVNRKECWFMKRKGEKISLPATIQPTQMSTPASQSEIEEILKSLNVKGILDAKEKALHAFQTGTPPIKKRAIIVLEKLGEVEKF